MTKYGMLTAGFLAATNLSNVWAAPAAPATSQRPAIEAGDIPPPPPPPPSEKEAVGAAKTIVQRIVGMANDVLKNHKNFVNAEVAYLKDQNAVNKTNMDNAATALGNSLAAIKRLVSRMEKDMSASVKGEIEEVKTEVSKSTLPKKDKEDLMNELRDRLKKRQGDSSGTDAPASE